MITVGVEILTTVCVVVVAAADVANTHRTVTGNVAVLIPPKQNNTTQLSTRCHRKRLFTLPRSRDICHVTVTVT